MAQGSFSLKALEVYEDLVSSKLSLNFSEGGTYDFTRCQRPNGTTYGSPGKCRQGVEIGAKEKEESKQGRRMRLTAKIKKMSAEDLKKVASDPRLSEKQRSKLQELIASKSSSSAEYDKTPEKPTEPKSKSTPSKISDKRLKAAFDRAIIVAERAKKERETLTRQGVKWDDPISKAASAKSGRAEAVVDLLRQTYHARDRDAFLRAAGERDKVIKRARAIREEAEREAKAQGLSVWTLPDDHPLKQKWSKGVDLEDTEGRDAKERMEAAYFGEPAKVSKAPSDGGGKVDPSVPSRVPRGGADPKLKEFLDGAEVVMAFKPKGFSKFVKDGEAKNGFEAGTGGIKVGKGGYLDARRSGEMVTMGIPKSADPKDRPVYAAMEHPDRARSLQGGQYSGMAQYGGIQVVMNSSVKDRSTFTIGDSLDYNYGRGIMASPVRDPSNPKREQGDDKSVDIDFKSPNTLGIRIFSRAMDAAPTPPGYVEAQIHGGLRSSDIKEVRYYKGHEIPIGTRRLLEKQGVKIVELPPRMGDLKIYSDSPNYKDLSAIEPE